MRFIYRGTKKHDAVMPVLVCIVAAVEKRKPRFPVNNGISMNIIGNIERIAPMVDPACINREICG